MLNSVDRSAAINAIVKEYHNCSASCCTLTCGSKYPKSLLRENQHVM